MFFESGCNILIFFLIRHKKRIQEARERDMFFEGKTQEEINQIRQELFLKSICILDDSHFS